MPSLAFRPARAEDIDRIVEIHTSAFPDPRGHEERRRNFLAKPFGPFADLHVAVLSRSGAPEEIVAHAFGFGFRVGVGGESVPITGIATVGVAPEARGQGYATKLVEHVVAIGESAGAVASFLYPFRQGFYARLGYVSAPHVHHLALAPAALRGLDERIRRAPSDAGQLLVRRTRDVDRSSVQALYAAEVSRATGLLVRSERLWNVHFADARRRTYLAEREGRPCGYVSISMHQVESHGETRIEVVDLVGETLADRAALLAWLAGFRDQVSEVDLCLAEGDALLPALLDLDVDRRRHGTARIEHAIGVLATGPMLRLASARRALEARGYRHDGAFELSVGPEAFGLVIEGGIAKCVAAGQGPRISFTPNGLAAVAYGGLSLMSASALGWASGDDEALFEASRALGLPAWHTWDRF